jgi:hypothetical protein
MTTAIDKKETMVLLRGAGRPLAAFTFYNLFGLALGFALLFLGRAFWPWPILPLALLAVVVSFHFRFLLTHALALSRPARVVLEAGATLLFALLYLALARLPALPVSLLAGLTTVASMVSLGLSEHWLSREDLGRRWT